MSLRAVRAASLADKLEVQEVEAKKEVDVAQAELDAVSKAKERAKKEKK